MKSIPILKNSHWHSLICSQSTFTSKNSPLWFFICVQKYFCLRASTSSFTWLIGSSKCWGCIAPTTSRLSRLFKMA